MVSAQYFPFGEYSCSMTESWRILFELKITRGCLSFNDFARLKMLWIVSGKNVLKKTEVCNFKNQLTVYKLTLKSCGSCKKCGRLELEHPKTVHNRLGYEVFLWLAANRFALNLIRDICPAFRLRHEESHSFAPNPLRANHSSHKSVCGNTFDLSQFANTRESELFTSSPCNTMPCGSFCSIIWYWIDITALD